MISEIEAKKPVSRAQLPETFLTALYRCQAPYRGCGHGCVYCDGRAEKFYVEGDFERDIVVRTNIAQAARASIDGLVTAREWGAICIGSGVTDVYQPLEAERGLTRRTLEVLSETGLPLVILTKSSLVKRDFDILSRFPRVLLIMTVTGVDEKIVSLVEPGAPCTAERLETLRLARKKGFMTGIMAMPLLPGPDESDMQTAQLFSAAANCGAGFVWPGGLTLRPGRQKDLFMNLVEHHWPDQLQQYRQLYARERPSGMPNSETYGPRARAWHHSLIKAGIPPMIPHSQHCKLLSPPDSLFVLLCHMQELYSKAGVDIRPLAQASARYTDWLKTERTALRRRRIPVCCSDPFPVTRVLEQKLFDLLEKDKAAGFASLTGNRRLTELARKIIVDGQTFDYCRLSAGQSQ